MVAVWQLLRTTPLICQFHASSFICLFSQCRQGSVEPFTLVEGPEAWYADEYRNRSDWITTLSPQHIAELDAAVGGIMQKGVEEIQVSNLHSMWLNLCALHEKPWLADSITQCSTNPPCLLTIMYAIKEFAAFVCLSRLACHVMVVHDMCLLYCANMADANTSIHTHNALVNHVPLLYCVC